MKNNWVVFSFNSLNTKIKVFKYNLSLNEALNIVSNGVSLSYTKDIYLDSNISLKYNCYHAY